jgi:hypothetical protein
MRTTDYIWIERWGKFLGSFDYYIKSEQSKALDENAPIGAIHKRDSGKWATIDEVTNYHTREYFEYHYADCGVEGFWKG